jgi:hypothetical protein
LTLQREARQPFTAYHLSAYHSPDAQTLAAFEGDLNLMAVHAPSGSIATQDTLVPGQPLALLTVWWADASPHLPLKVFVHVVDKDGNLRAQHDGLDSPSRFWHPGDVIIQAHAVVLPENLLAGNYELRVGLYNPETLQPYPLLDGRPFFEAGWVTVQNGS